MAHVNMRPFMQILIIFVSLFIKAHCQYYGYNDQQQQFDRSYTTTTDGTIHFINKDTSVSPAETIEAKEKELHNKHQNLGFSSANGQSFGNQPVFSGPESRPLGQSSYNQEAGGSYSNVQPPQFGPGFSNPLAAQQPQSEYTPASGANMETHEALSTFSLEMLQKFSAKNKRQNIVISPLSMATILSYLQQVSSGRTQAELSGALKQSPLKSLRSYSDIIGDIKQRSNGKNQLLTANAMFVNGRTKLFSQARNIATQQYMAHVEPLDFGNPDRAADRINSWVSKHTQNVINELIQPYKLDRNSEAVLLNAMYFKGVWEKKFDDKRTKLMDYSAEVGAKSQKLFMLHNERFDVGDDDNIGARWISLPYDGGKYSMVFVLPQHSHTLDDFIANLKPSELFDIMTKGEDYKCAIAIAKFNVTYDTSMVDVLQDMGIRRAFTTNSEIDQISDNNRRMTISSANQKSTMAIDESGTVAASASSIGVNTLSLPSPNEIFVFRLTQPFLAILVDKNLKIPIMIAKIYDP